MAVESISLLHIIITLSILLFAAKLFAELFHRIKMPVVLGELLAGIIVGPYALGGIIPIYNGEPLVVLDETIRHIGEISAIVILFIAGLEITPREFLKGGASVIYCRFTWSNSTVLCWLLCIYYYNWIRSNTIYAYCNCLDCHKYCNIYTSIN